MITIRLATPNDFAAIESCARDAYAKYVERIGREPAPMVADFATQIDDGLVHVAVAADSALREVRAWILRSSPRMTLWGARPLHVTPQILSSSDLIRRSMHCWCSDQLVTVVGWVAGMDGPIEWGHDGIGDGSAPTPPR